MAELGRTIARAEAVLHRVRSETTGIAARARRRRWNAFIRRVKLAVAAVIAIMLAAVVAGVLLPGGIGIGGFALAMLAMMVASGAILLWPGRARDASPAALAQTDLRLLPQHTEEWLERQRPALPAPAISLVDAIGARLDVLGPQLATLDPQVPAAAELRKLMAEELPELVSGYQRVPPNLRRDERNGISPDRQLVEGLKVVDSELARMADQLARGDLDRLATQNRYLELKYRGADDQA